MTQKLEKLLNQLIKLHPKYIDLSLDRISLLLHRLGNPHHKLSPIIHIAGTNGKGSTLSYIYHILKENGYLVHCYISPHLESIEERFTVSNKKITTKKLFDTLIYVKKINKNNPITFYEITTAAAFYLFSKHKSDFTILETGLGGRLDATNIIENSMIDIITPISLDHKEFLGNNIKNIANEKLGIIKKTSTVIIGKQKALIKNYIKKKIKKLNNNKIFFGEEFKIIKKNHKYFLINYNNKLFKFPKPSLLGQHQVENALLAIIGVLQISVLGYKISKTGINKGLKNTFWPGRLEQGYLKKIPVYLDGAHNIAGAEQIFIFFKNSKVNRWLIFGMLNNKDLKNYLLKLKKIISGVIAIKIPKEKNTFSLEEIEKACKKLDIKCIKKRNIFEANRYLINTVKPNEIIISGSLYLVGKIRGLYI